ncbi:MAG TPA: hypothetical protein PKO06_06790, partial [Candidatus Ozemobacteraceae bacterium]|nr:hypothetical protein [Candidatus Ozemobacteraceae bacterium]
MAERIGRSAAVKPQTHCWLGASAAERFGAGLIVWFLLLVWMPVWAQSPLKVALVGALTGPKAVYGLSHRDGAHLAAEMIGSRSISLIDIDDAGDSGKVGPFVVDAVMRQQVHALMGSVDSGCTHVLAMVAVKLHV